MREMNACERCGRLYLQPSGSDTTPCPACGWVNGTTIEACGAAGLAGGPELTLPILEEVTKPGGHR